MTLARPGFTALSQAQPAGSPGTPGQTGSPQAGAPSSALMATPQAKLGQQAKAAGSIQMAVRVLSMASIAFDPMSDEAKAIRKAMDALSKAFGRQQHEGQDLVPTEIQSLMSGLRGPQQAPGGAAPRPGMTPGQPGAVPPTAGG